MYESGVVVSYYFIFWFIISVILAVLAGAAFLYLCVLLRDIKRSLASIEKLLAAGEPKGRKGN